ncbi:hypothetical protein [Streptomyces graminilatus]|uniref:hypothetical protein n=1 Tax=Streptomyces graminilatus TaxID=1464070 RepID=UPI0006E1962B|nr:hypothetical protein [Streptomyces graminilatus]
MSADTNTVTVGGARGVPGRPARPDRPRRFDDDALNDAYWARVIANVAAAPPLTDRQKAILRAQFHAPAAIREAA